MESVVGNCGISPSKKLSFNFKYCRRVKFAISMGITPVIKLFAKSLD